VMSWDAPSFPKDEQINENMVLLVLAGPHYRTERDALAWIAYPATQQVSAFAAQKGLPPPTVQAWQATLAQAAGNGRKSEVDIGYVIHDAHNTRPASPDRIAYLAQTLTTEVPAFDFLQQSFNTPALLGEMGAATALTNVALGIAQANHFGQNVLVAGTSDAGQTTGVLILPPAKVRPIRSIPMKWPARCAISRISSPIKRWRFSAKPWMFWVPTALIVNTISKSTGVTSRSSSCGWAASSSARWKQPGISSTARHYRRPHHARSQ